MHVLALDTTTREGSVALVAGDRIVEERRGDFGRTHAERLPGELIEVAAAHGLDAHAIDLYGVASGPGSFTGLRIGIATIQGLALASRRRVVAVSALEAIAQTVEGAPGTFVAAWIDARRRDVFAALYRIAAGPAYSPDRLVEIEGPTVGDPSATLARWRARIGESGVTFAGDGARLYGEAITGQARTGWTVTAVGLPLAGAIGRMALARAARGETLHPAAIQPLYVRRPDAEVEREKRTLAAAETKDARE